MEIVDCLHIQQLKHAHLTQTAYLPRTRLDHLISAQGVNSIFIPLHVFGNHWTLLQIDLFNATYSYADCLHNANSPPSSTFGLIQWWLTSLLPSPPLLQPVPFKLDLPRQRDGFSCGVIVLDLMATILLQKPIWEPQRAAVQRMEWFLHLSADFDALSAVSLYSYGERAGSNIFSSSLIWNIIPTAIKFMTLLSIQPASRRLILHLQHSPLLIKTQSSEGASGYALCKPILLTALIAVRNQIHMMVVLSLAVVVMAV
jgi:hypothetical protein